MGRLVLDGNRLVAAGSTHLRARRRLLHNGSAMVTLVLDRGGSLLEEPRLSFEGVIAPDVEAEILDQTLAAIEDALDRVARARRSDDEEMAEVARIAVRRFLLKATGNRPVIRVHVVRVD